MCRWLAYRGRALLMEKLVTEPAHSLIAQSLHSDESKAVTNGDGFGVGWYGERPEPGLFRDVRPAWSDENLKAICAHVRSRLFFAHVRATTGSAVSRANCHPFSQGRHMFMHNGQIGGFSAIRRKVEALIPDALYADRHGSTDSEAIFLIALANGLDRDPVAAMAKTLAQIAGLMRAAGIDEALRLTAAVSDGQTLIAYRWASDRKAPSLYYQEANGDLLIVSEPLDSDREGWKEIPQACALVARPGQGVERRCMEEAMLKAA